MEHLADTRQRPNNDLPHAQHSPPKDVLFRTFLPLVYQLRDLEKERQDGQYTDEEMFNRLTVQLGNVDVRVREF